MHAADRGRDGQVRTCTGQPVKKLGKQHNLCCCEAAQVDVTSACMLSLSVAGRSEQLFG